MLANKKLGSRGEAEAGGKGNGDNNNHDDDGVNGSFLEGIRRSSFPPVNPKLSQEHAEGKPMSAMRAADRLKIQQEQQNNNNNGPMSQTPNGSSRFGKRDSLEVERPQLSSADKNYLRKRKLDMDKAFLEASND
jgi:hypothetical protein